MIATYPVALATPESIRKANQNKLLAGVLFWLRASIQGHRENVKTRESTEFDNVKAEWINKYQDLAIPPMNLPEIQSLDLGSFQKHEESECEAWNRCQAVLNSLKSTTTKSKWQDNFGNANKDPYSSSSIPESRTPS